jgi:transcriptional regulator with XRE-family HTH domain
MSTLLNTELFSSMVNAKRGGLGLRAAAEEIGNISAATLSRIEQGNVPDVETFIRICHWLNVSSDIFILSEDEPQKREISTQDVIVAHLRADKTLDPEASKTLVEVINHFYKVVH